MPADPFSIRRLHAGDMPAVMRIQAACYTQIVPESHASMAAKVDAAPLTCFLAQAGDAAVGYLIAVPVAYPRLPALDAPTYAVPPDADTLYLHDLAVAPAGRGTGAAQALVRVVLEAGQAAGLRRACLVAIQDSVAFWQRFGFAPVHAPDAQVAEKLSSYGAGARLMVAAG